MPLSRALLALLLTGCAAAPASKGPEAEEVDADTDADGDADTDSDSDTDADVLLAELAADDVPRMRDGLLFVTRTAVHGAARVDAAAGRLEGEVVYETWVDGIPDCSVVVGLSGEADAEFTGACPDCELSFRLSPTVDWGASEPGCLPDPLLSYVATDEVIDLGLSYQPEFFYDTHRYTDLLGTVYSAVRGADDEVFGPYNRYVLFTSEAEATHSRGSVSRSAEGLDWLLDEEVPTYGVEPAYLRACAESSATTAGYLEGQNYGGIAHEDELDCSGDTVDVWTLWAEAGQTLRASLDTVSNDQAFDGRMLINGPEDCTLIEADNSFTCTYRPSQFACPSAVVPVASSGAYSVVVWAFGECFVDRAPYRLSLRVD